MTILGVELVLYWENKAIHDPDRSQLLLDLIVEVVTVAEAALQLQPYKKVCALCEAVTLIIWVEC